MTKENFLFFKPKALETGDQPFFGRVRKKVIREESWKQLTRFRKENHRSYEEIP